MNIFSQSRVSKIFLIIFLRFIIAIFMVDTARAELVKFDGYWLDTETNIEWHPPKSIPGISSAEVSTFTAPGQIAEGFRPATWAEFVAIRNKIFGRSVEEYCISDLRIGGCTLTENDMVRFIDFFGGVTRTIPQQCGIQTCSLFGGCTCLGYNTQYRNDFSVMRPDGFFYYWANLYALGEIGNCVNGNICTAYAASYNWANWGPSTGPKLLVKQRNRPPRISPVPELTAKEGSILEYKFIYSDPDGDIIKIAGANLPPGARIDGDVLRWLPSYNQAGRYTGIQITASDSFNPPGTHSITLSISVGNTNRPPEFQELTSKRVVEAELLQFDIVARDPDGDNFRLWANSIPAGAQFIGAVFSWRPSYTDAGVYNVSFTAEDSFGAKSTSYVEITVGQSKNKCGVSHYMIEIIDKSPLSQGLKSAYRANLKTVCDFSERGQLIAAKQGVDAFLKKIERDRLDGQLPEAQLLTLRQLGGELRNLF